MDRGQDTYEGPGSLAKHAFLTYNSKDLQAAAQVRSIEEMLTRAGLKTWLDKEDAIPGDDPADQMANALEHSHCAVFFLGGEGFGRWQDGLEYRLALARRVTDQLRVFAVLLPGSVGAEAIPGALQAIGTYVDLRNEFVDGQLTSQGFLLLRAGVERKTPRELSERDSRQAPTASPADDATAPGAPGCRRALLVGISDYGPELKGRLNGPLTDIDRLAEALTALEAGPDEQAWTVDSRSDLTKDQLSDALRQIFSDDASENDTRLFYFSGEGFVDLDGTSYLCTVDTNPNQAFNSAVSAGEVRARVSSCSAREKIVILDCCRGKPLTADPYRNLGPGIAVFGASVGEARAADSETDLSPFTEALLAAMSGPRSPDETTLTVGDLLDRLSMAERSPWTNDGLDRDIVLATQARAPAPRESELADDFKVSITSVQGIERLPVLRQLSVVLDNLLAVADDRRKIPCAVVGETIRLLGNELADLALGERRDELTREICSSDPQNPVRVSVAFDPGTHSELRDLPWEYLGFCDPVQVPDPVDPGALPDIRDLRPVERLLQGSRTKHAGNATPQRGVLFCALQPDSQQSDRHALLESFESQYPKAKLRLGVEVFRPATWRQFRTNPTGADLVILQARIRMRGGMAQVGFGSPGGELADTREIDLLNTVADPVGELTLPWRALTWLVVETIAEDPTWQAPLATRRFAHNLAQRCQRNVVAICHPPAYRRCLRDGPGDDTFLDMFVRNLARGRPLGQAAYGARQAALAALQVDGSVIGIPIVIRPEWRPEKTASDSKRVPSKPSPQRGTAAGTKAEARRAGDRP